MELTKRVHNRPLAGNEVYEICILFPFRSLLCSYTKCFIFYYYCFFFSLLDYSCGEKLGIQKKKKRKHGKP